MMLDMEYLKNLGEEAGFTHVCPLDVDTIDLKPEVRDMCASGKCKMYGTNWCCPPGVGTLEECGERIRKYSHGILVQTVGELEDEWDGEGMMDAQEKHMESFNAMYPELKKTFPKALAVGTGTCMKCKKCTYPDAPCRFPEYSFASMESLGMLVSEVCKKNGMDYYYGKCTIAYTACFLLE